MVYANYSFLRLLISFFGGEISFSFTKSKIIFKNVSWNNSKIDSNLYKQNKISPDGLKKIPMLKKIQMKPFIHIKAQYTVYI